MRWRQVNRSSMLFFLAFRAARMMCPVTCTSPHLREPLIARWRQGYGAGHARSLPLCMPAILHVVDDN